MRNAFRKYKYAIRNKTSINDGAWNLPLSLGDNEDSKPILLDLINRLPTEILGQILRNVYESAEASKDICSCSRPETPYETARSRSLIHRVVDTFAIRLTCSRWHSWALESILSGVAGDNQHIEVDISNVTAIIKKMNFPPGGVAKRLAQDFPFLARTGITLYLGNPGEVSNLMLVVGMLGQEKQYGSEYYRIFTGLSFWDLGSLYRDVLKQAPWHAHDLLLLDIISHFSAMPVPTRVQFPATIFAAISHEYWAPILEGLLRHSDRLSMREFLTTNHAPLTPRLRPTSPVFIPDGNYLDLEKHFAKRHYTVPVDIDGYCTKLHTSVSLGPEELWKRLKHIKLTLKTRSDNGAQRWRIDDAFLAKMSCCQLVSVQIDGGLAASLTIHGLLLFLQPSSKTLKKLVYRPAVADPGTTAKSKGEEIHHCQVLSSASFERNFPLLEDLELHVSCCPDLFDPKNGGIYAWKSALKRRWKLVIPRTGGRSDGFCPDWIARIGAEDTLGDFGVWDSKSLNLFFKCARVARDHLLAREMAEVEILQSRVMLGSAPDPVPHWVQTLLVTGNWGDPSMDSRLGGAEKALQDKLREVMGKWQLEIHMKDVKIYGKHHAQVNADTSR